MKRMHIATLIGAFTVGGFLVTACGNDQPTAEDDINQAIELIDDAADDAADATEDAAGEVESVLEDAADDVEDAVDQ